MRKKQLTLHKRNELVRGGDKYSVLAKRALNAIYYLVQHNVNSGNAMAIQKSEYISIEFAYLRKMMGLEKVESYINEIEKALKELQKPLELNNFKNPKDKQIYDWYSISFISEASWQFDEKKRRRIAYIALSPLTKWLMIHSNEGNFTRFDLIPTINKLRTKYSMKLYEFFKSFEKFRYIDLSQNYLLKILGLEDVKTYQSYYEFKRLLTRQIKEIKEKTDLKELMLVEPTKDMKKEKIFKFIINPKSKRELKDKRKVENVINQIIKRF